MKYPSKEQKSGYKKKIYQCPVCKSMHNIYFPHDFSKNRSRYSFTYIFIHNFKNSEKIEDKDKDILTTLFIDAKLQIRGVEAILIEDDANILAKETSKEIIDKLTQVIFDLQENNNKLLENYQALIDKYEK